MKTNKPDILQIILNRKLEEIVDRKKTNSLMSVRNKAETSSSKTRGFIHAIKSKVDKKQPAVIAEIKKASPSKGIIRENFKPAEIARSYERNGATCLSVLTDKYFFQGADHYLVEARNATNLPVIRKDFIIDPYQVYEAKILKADCILLIVSALTKQQLINLISLANELDIDVLVEVHNKDEMLRAIDSDAKLIGINNRNLSSFEVNLNTTLDMLSMLPEDRILVTESGIHSRQDVELIRSNNVNAFLIGEAFMRKPEPGQELFRLFN